MKNPTTSGTIPEGDIPRFIASATRLLPPGSLIAIAVPRGGANDIHLHGCTGSKPGEAMDLMAATQAAIDRQADAVIDALADETGLTREQVRSHYQSLLDKHAAMKPLPPA